MAEFPVGGERLLKQLVSTYRCSLCRRGYERDQVRVAARYDQLWIVSARCRGCRRQQVFCFVPNPDGDDSMLRDVTAEERELFASLPPVTLDEVLDMHDFLRRFNGDFKRLFST